jgi:hypothetical protein
MFVSEEPPLCPRISILADAAKVTRFRPGAGQGTQDEVLKAELTRYQGSCFYDRDAKQMTISLRVGIDAMRGAAAGGQTAKLDYFVAIPTFFPDPQAKTIMPVSIEFEKDKDRLRYTDDEVQVVFPLPNVREMARYEVFVGLQLDAAELERNRQVYGHP